MTRERAQRFAVGLVVIVLVASALGYLLVPLAMLRIVGIEGDRTVASWSEPSPPPCWPLPRVPGLYGAGMAPRRSAAS